MSRVLVTGGGRGLGLELVRAFLERGHRVTATVRDPASAPGLAELATAHPGRIAIAALDVTDTEAVAGVVRGAVAWQGGMDVVVNSAGVNAMSVPGGRATLSVATMEAEPMMEVLRVNTVAPLLVARAALDALRASDRPRIVNISSWLGAVTTATGSGNYAYSASKAALNMTTRLLANELRDAGIVVVAVNPGWVRTSMGGPRATLSPAESAAGIAALTDGLTMAASGTFLQWDGGPHPW